MAVTFFREKIYPYESLWSIFHKFALWNACGSSDIIDLLCPSKGMINPCLLKSSYLSGEKTASFLGLSPEVLNYGVLETYFQDNEINFFAETKTLRFCPRCLETGYHSIFHQIYLIHECSFHGISLEDNCPSCGRCLGVRLSSLKYEELFKCKWCNFHLVAEDQDFLSLTSKTFDDAYGGLYFSLTKRKGFSPITNQYRMQHYTTDDIFKNRIISDKIIRSWMSIYGEYNHNTQDFAMIEISPEFNELNMFEEYFRFIHEWLTEIIGEHVNCISYLSLKGWWMYDGQSLNNYTLCPIALAYFCWRMIFEQKRSAHGLNLLPFEGRGGSVIHWAKPQVDPSVSSYIFKSEMKMAFLSLLSASRLQIIHNSVVIKKEIPPADIPYWETYFDHEKGRWIVWHWALPKAEIIPFDSRHLNHLMATVAEINRVLL